MNIGERAVLHTTRRDEFSKHNAPEDSGEEKRAVLVLESRMRRARTWTIGARNRMPHNLLLISHYILDSCKLLVDNRSIGFASPEASSHCVL